MLFFFLNIKQKILVVWTKTDRRSDGALVLSAFLLVWDLPHRTEAVLSGPVTLKRTRGQEW